MELGLWSSGDEPAGGTARSLSFGRGLAPPEDWDRAHDALFSPDAVEAYITIDAQIRAVEILGKRVESSPERAYVERCVAHLDRVRDALHDLHFCAGDARARENKAHPLGAYLVAVHLWCRDLLEGLRLRASPLRGSTSPDAPADDSSPRVVAEVDPRFRDLLVFRMEPDPDEVLHPIFERAERVHSEIVQLHQALR